MTAKRNCVAGKCICINNNMKCTESCKLDSCDNFGNDSVDSFDISDLESSDDEVVDDD